jgi:hypothetical protein
MAASSGINLQGHHLGAHLNNHVWPKIKAETQYRSGLLYEHEHKPEAGMFIYSPDAKCSSSGRRGLQDVTAQ